MIVFGYLCHSDTDARRGSCIVKGVVGAVQTVAIHGSTVVAVDAPYTASNIHVDFHPRTCINLIKCQGIALEDIPTFPEA